MSFVRQPDSVQVDLNLKLVEVSETWRPKAGISVRSFASGRSDLGSDHEDSLARSSRDPLI